MRVTPVVAGVDLADGKRRSPWSWRMSDPYDVVAPFYSEWAGTESNDVRFYVAVARATAGPVLELGVGTGRIALAIAGAGIEVVGVDTSKDMLRMARARAIADRVDLTLVRGDIRHVVFERAFALVICPFNTMLHFAPSQRTAVFVSARRALAAGGRFVFDALTPADDQIEATHARRVQLSDGLFQTAAWDVASQRLDLTVERRGVSARFVHHWATPREWTRQAREAGFAHVAVRDTALLGWGRGRYVYECS
jgi:SAM-dependent methyltransferase